MSAPKDPQARELWLQRLRENAKKASEAARQAHKEGRIKLGRQAGFKQTEEHKTAVSNKLKGQPIHPNTLAALVGHIVSEETREKQRRARAKQIITPEQRLAISKTLTGRKQPMTSKRILAANGTGTYLDWRYDPRYQEVKKMAHERDNYTCKHCGKTNITGRQCHAHHVKDGENFPEFRFDIDNIQTLCAACHVKLEPRIQK